MVYRWGSASLNSNRLRIKKNLSSTRFFAVTDLPNEAKFPESQNGYPEVVLVHGGEDGSTRIGYSGGMLADMRRLLSILTETNSTKREFASITNRAVPVLPTD